MEIAILLSPALVPIAALLIARALGWRSLAAQLGAAAAAGAATGAFLATAAAAMSTASDPDEALRRGLLIGALLGLVVGAAWIGLAGVVRRVLRHGA